MNAGQGLDRTGFLSGTMNNASAAGAPPPFVFYRFNASLTIIIAVLVMAFFFMGMVALYVWRCSSEDNLEAALQAVGMIRNRRRPAEGAAATAAAAAGTQCRGLDKATVELLFPVVFCQRSELSEAAKDECAVCLGEISEGDKIRVLTTCQHSFHSRCIDAWLGLHASCPVCRGNLAKLAVPRDQQHHPVVIDMSNS